MLGFFKKRKEEDERIEEEVEYFKNALALALDLLVSSYQRPLLRWYELLIIVVCSAFLGLGLGVILFGLLGKYFVFHSWQVVP